MSAPNWESIEDTLYDLVVAAIPNVTTRWANQDVPFPSTLPLLTLEWLTADVGEGRRSDDAVFVAAVTGPPLVAEHFDRIHRRTRVLSVQCYSTSVTGSNTAVARLGLLERALQTDAVVNTLDAANLAVISLESVADLTSLATSRRESRATLDMTIGFFSTTSEALGAIDTLVIDPAPVYS